MGLVATRNSKQEQLRPMLRTAHDVLKDESVWQKGKASKWGENRKNKHGPSLNSVND